MLLKRKYIRLILLLILPAYLLILGNSIKNRHTHILPNGMIVTHAHPINNQDQNKPINQHGHTKAEIYFFQLTTIDYYEIYTEFVYTPYVTNECRVVEDYVSLQLIPNCLLTLSLRAPPTTIV